MALRKFSVNILCTFLSCWEGGIMLAKRIQADCLRELKSIEIFKGIGAQHGPSYILLFKNALQCINTKRALLMKIGK